MKTYRKHAITFDVLTEEKICRAYQRGIRLTRLAKRYGVSITVIYRVLKAYQIPMTRKTLSYREDVFDAIDTELKAYVLGLITTDGYIVKDLERTRYVVTLCSVDREIPNFFAQLIEYSRPIYKIKDAGQKPHWKQEWRISVCSKRLVLALEQLGVIKKSVSENFCEKVPRYLLRHYIRGIFDGDGCLGDYQGSTNGVPNRSQATIALVGSKNFVQRVADVITDEVGMESRVHKKHGELYDISYGGNNKAIVIMKWLYADSKYAMIRKKKIAESLFKRTARRSANTETIRNHFDES